MAYSRQTRFTAYAGAYIVLLIAVLVAVNFLANRYNKSIDTTANKRYSLSDQTEKVVRNLRQDVKITVFEKTDRFGSDRDLLDRYANLSPKLKVEYIDPFKQPQLAKAAGVRKLGTIQVESGNKKEEARTLSEQELTGAIIRTIKTGDRAVCAASGGGERTFADTEGDGLSAAKTALERNNYKTKTLNLIQKPEIPSDCTILLIAGPRADYPEPALAAIKGFVEKGGSALFLFAAPVRTAKEIPQDPKALFNLIASWGIEIGDDVIMDESGLQGNAFVPLVGTYKDHPIVRELGNLVTAFPLARRVEPKPGGKAAAQTIFSSESTAFATTSLDFSKLSSMKISDMPKEKPGPVSMAATVTFPGSDTNTKRQARVAVFGDMEWATNALSRFYGNPEMFLNTMDWLSADEDLISIRPRETEDRRFSLKPGQGWLAALFSFLPALSVVIAGLLVWLRRR